jgi:hypothetical protein
LGMRRLIVAIVIACLATGPAEAAPRRPVLLGTDPASDSQPGLDLTYLAAAVDRKVLEIRIGIAGMTPGLGGYPELPGVEWKFELLESILVHLEEVEARIRYAGNGFGKKLPAPDFSDGDEAKHPSSLSSLPFTLSE